jgi:hypothetical protein
MKSIRGGAALMLLLLSPLGVHAAPPTYVVLRLPQQTAGAPAHPGIPLGYTTPATRQAYAYGWFGATPRRHTVKHYGVRNHYIQKVWQ